MIGPGHLRMYARFALGLPGFLAERTTIEQARALLAERLAHRDDNFLKVAEHGIYGHAKSPYLGLLRRAGCELGDLRRMVRADGLEPTLSALRSAGVYISFEEWKGRVPIVRGDYEARVDTHAFDNPHLRKVYEGTTGGSTGVGTRLSLDLDDIAARAPITLLVQEAHGVLGLPRATTFGRLPDQTAINSILGMARTGHSLDRWFCPVIEGRPKTPLQYRLTHHYIVRVGRLLGMKVPDPEPMPMNETVRIARWAAQACRERGGACDLVERQHGGAHRPRGSRRRHRPHGHGDDQRWRAADAGEGGGDRRLRRPRHRELPHVGGGGDRTRLPASPPLPTSSTSRPITWR